MSNNSSHHENSIIEQLKEENNKLKLLLQERNDNPEEYHSGITNTETDPFEKVRFISNIAYWKFSTKNNKLESSKEAYKIFEISPKDEVLNTTNVLKYFHPEDKKRFLAEWEKKVSVENYFEIESRIIVSDGSIKFISIKVLVEREKNHKPIALYGIITDNTETHFKIENLKENRNLFYNLFHNLTDIFIIFEVVKDSEGKITDYIYKDVNPTFEMKMGLTKNEVSDKKLSTQVSLFEQFHPLFNLSVIAGQPQQDRFFIQSLDSFFDVLIYAPSENHLATIWRDVSLMVEAESSLRESEEKYRQIFSIGSDALFMIDIYSGRILDVNPIGCKMFGFSKDSLLKMIFKQLSATPEKLEEQILNQRSILLDEVAQRMNGSQFPIEISLSYFNWSGRKVLVASIRDISERIIAQDKLIKSEQKFKQLFDYSNDAILILKNYRIIDFNQKSASLFKLKPDQLLNKTLWNLSPDKQMDDDDSRTKAVEYIQNSLLGNQHQFEWIFQRNDHTTFFADIKLSPIIVGDEKVIQAIVRDISPQKETQQALKNKEELWKSSLEISTVGVWNWNIITNEVYLSQVWKSMLGYEKDEIKNEFDEFKKRLHPDDIPNFNNAINDYLSSKSDNFAIEYRMRCKNGTYKWINSIGKINSFNSEGKPKHFLGTHTDVTKQKIFTEKLTSEINVLTEAGNISQLGYWELDLRTMVVTGSKNTFSIFGFNQSEQLSLRQIELLIHPEDQKNFISQFVLNSEKSTQENIFRINIPNQTKYIISKSYQIKNSKNILIGYKGTFQDITSLKRDDDTLKEEKNFFKSIIENFRQPLQVIQNDQILFSNERTIELTGYSNKEIISDNITPLNLTVSEDRFLLKKLIDSISANPLLSEKIEIRIETKNNRIKWIELSISLLKTRDNPAFLFVMNDISNQKKIETELLLSEKRLNSIALNAAIGIALIDLSGNIFYSNKSFIILTGTEPTDLKKKKYESFFNEIDSITISKGIEAINLSISTQFSGEFNIVAENSCWVNLIIKPVFSFKNKLDYYIFYLESIDSKKKMEKKLINENLMVNLILDNSPIGMAIFNNKHELIYFNQKFAEDLQFHTSLKSKLNLFDIELFLINQFQITNRVLKEKIPYNFDLQTQQKKNLNIEIVPVLINNENSLIIYSKDITSTKTEIELLMKQIERFEGIFNNAPIGITLIDKNRNIILSNQFFSQLVDFESNELAYMKLDRLVGTQYLSEIISRFSQLFTGVTSTFQQVLKMISKNSESFWINATASPLKDKYGDIKYAIYIVEDISQIKNEEHIMLSNERLHTLNYIANSFAHEFNNLLMGIYGNSYLLKSQLKDSKLAEYAIKLLNSTNRATELTHKLLSFSGKNNLISIAIDINEIIDNSLNTFQISPDIQIKKITNNKNEIIVGDPSQLKRAIQIIIENALESMSKGGILTIENSIVYFDSVMNNGSSSLDKGKYLRIVITDTGVGIHPNDISKIFDPFYSTKPFSQNAGLGLSIAQRIINLHEGIIKVFSSIDNGSNFNIYIPLKDVEMLKATNQPNEKQILKGSANILLIDDEEVVRLITSELLNELGYDVYSFSGGKKALQFYKDNSKTIDLVLLDKHMPEMDGLEVYKKMKEINPHAKILILTGYNIDKEMEELFSVESNQVIQKPVSIEKLSQTISEILYNKKD
jgi:PAS domain S-box-containing protein